MNLAINFKKTIARRNARSRASEGGFALASAIIVFFIISVLAASYLSSVQISYKMVGMQCLQNEAIYLARSGITYYSVNQSQVSSSSVIPIDSNKIILELVSINGTTYIKSTGIINNDAGIEIARQAIIAPTSALNKWRRV